MFFFFQAEDGIRDHCVTGVQTCALPISLFRRGDATLRGAGPCLQPDRPEGGGWSSDDYLGTGNAASESRVSPSCIASARRSEERRVGKECRCRGASSLKKNKQVTKMSRR